MGGGSWTDAAYGDRATSRAKTGISAFAFSDSSKASGVLKVHKNLDPKKKNKAGQIIRESRDSKEHPESLGIAVLIDVTGSMSGTPKIFQAALPKLMGLLLRKGYVDHPHVLFGAVGDGYSDCVPVQIGQFESDITMEDCLSQMILEGNGGGSMHESYQLAMHFLAEHAAMDCVEKRGHKGFLFILGDEAPYDSVTREHAKQWLGEDIEADIPIEAVVAKLKEKFNVFFIQPAGASYQGEAAVLGPWKKLLQQNVLHLSDANAVCEFIAGIIGVNEGRLDADQFEADLLDVGTDSGSAKVASKALTTYARSAGITKTAKVTGDLATADTGAPAVERV